MRKTLIAILFVFNIISGCKKSDSPTPLNDDQNASESKLVSATLVYSASKNTLISLAQNSGFDEFTELIEYDVNVFYVIYKTNFQGQSILVSGLIASPVQPFEAFPLLVGNHGTITKKSLAPSESPENSELILLSAAGYITILPDYIGFGISKQYLHPYYIQSYSSGCVTDMIIATKEMIAQTPGLNTDNKLFLFGYSEGGYVTMATHKKIEGNNLHKITACAVGAGGYNLENIMVEVLNEAEYPSPVYLAYIIHSYNTYYNWQKPLSYFFKEPYASSIPRLFNGSYSLGQINNSLSNDLETLFNSDFLSSLRNGTDPYILPALIKNSVHDWTPIYPIQMFHGTQDEVVSYNDSEMTFMNFKNNGVQNVEFYPIDGGTHGSSLAIMINEIIPWYKALNVDF